MPAIIVLIGLVLLTGSTVQFAKNNVDGIPEVMVNEEDADRVESSFITLEEGMHREDISERIGEMKGYREEEIHQFHDTYRSMQWDAFNGVLISYVTHEYQLTKEDREILLTHATIFLDQEEDVLESLYLPMGYRFLGDESMVEVIERLLEPVRALSEESLRLLIDSTQVLWLVHYVRNETELLPDLVPLPPQDVGLRYVGGEILLVFTTIYYNQGKGNLELRADPSTIATLGDFDREVFQRIYRENDTYRERSAGTFEWHNEHIHYHFVDFIEFRLESVDGDLDVVRGQLAEKSTFCIRDVSRVYLPLVSSTSKATYRICGRERQGVSVGWGDAYFSTYPDQNLNITDISSGTYKLSFIANPSDRFDEITKSNNVSVARIRYDKEARTVEVLETYPTELPRFEHIHVEQDL